MSNTRKLLILLVVMGALVAVGAIAYRVGVQQGLAQTDGFRRVMENMPENVRGLRDGQPFGHPSFRMRPMLPVSFMPRMVPWVVLGAVALGVVAIALYAVLTPRQVSSAEPGQRKAATRGIRGA